MSGLTQEPEIPTAEDGDRPQAKDRRWQLGALALAVALVGTLFAEATVSTVTPLRSYDEGIRPPRAS